MDEKNNKWHIFCRSAQYEDAYQHLCDQEDKPLGEEFFYALWHRGFGEDDDYKPDIIKQEYRENLKLYGRHYFTWGDCCPLCYRKEVVKK